jgi:AcrR family transcriptional regulator
VTVSTDPQKPRSSTLSREVVLHTALQIIDDEGVDGLSMRRLARALGRDPMSLYREETDDLLRLGLHRLPLREFPRLRSLAPVLGAYDGAAELKQGVDILWRASRVSSVQSASHGPERRRGAPAVIVELLNHVAQSRSGVVHGKPRGWPDRSLERTDQ